MGISSSLSSINAILPSAEWLSNPIAPTWGSHISGSNEEIENTQEEFFELEELIRLRSQYTNNPLITYLNINSLRNKIFDLREIILKALPDILVVAETKLNNDFPTQNFIVENYQTPLRRDRNEDGGGLMQFNRKGVICNRVATLESKYLETIRTELNVNKKKWAIFAVYSPPATKKINM